MVIRVTHVSIIEEPNISNIKNFASLVFEERLKVLNGLDKIGEPDHGGEISSSTGKELSTELNILSVVLSLGLGADETSTGLIDGLSQDF